jgi:glycogen debranching enzyme
MPQLAKRCLREYAIACIAISALILSNCRLEAQTETYSAAFSELVWTTDSTGPRRFISVHGRRAAIFGYSEDGLEVWTYPVQILSGYTVTFRQQGATTEIDGQTLLRRVMYSPEAVTRVYAGPDFIVREKLFVPLDEPGVIVRYEVDSARALDIEIRFTPVLDLMWPASIGGQDTMWNSTASAYLLSELTYHFTGSIGSPDIVTHDETPNDRQRVQRSPGLAFTIRAGGEHRTARVVIAGGGSGQDSGATATALLTDSAESMLERSAVDHYTNLLGQSLQIETPDAETNRALAWAEVALDQAWVCNPDLGCGEVAGYGPSRKARRPQYDWFFAGDGMVAIPALLAAGQYDRARQELEFVLKYQDQKSGMIWHELAQSAASLDWNKYPYMFVHVELTFDFLNTIENYVSVTGDTDFAKAHWQSIQSAYEYCRSLLDPKDGLPRIPAGKEGGREQDALNDELALSTSWAKAARAYSHLASGMGDEAAATGAIAASQRASDSIDKRYWDEQKHFWVSGYTRSGAPLIDRSIGPTRSMGMSLISRARQESVLDQFASADFQTDWGTRGRASSDSTYDPNSYASGSVWATGTASMASAFWADHRPATAFPIWNALVPWSSLDSFRTHA